MGNTCHLDFPPTPDAAAALCVDRFFERDVLPGLPRAALAQPDHFTAEQLLGYARSIDDSVARATVYRTLPIMTESALLREVDIGAGEKYYRANRAGQDSQVAQVVCLDCDRIFEIGAPFMSWYGNSVSSKLGLTPVSQRLQVSARCDALRDTAAALARQVQVDWRDVVLANIISDVLCIYADNLVDSVNPGGVLALSGILAKEQAAVREHFEAKAKAAWGEATTTDGRVMGEWSDVALFRPL